MKQGYGLPKKLTANHSFYLLLIICWLGVCQGGAATLGTSFTYQGRLADNGANASGIYSLRFTAYDAATAGTQVGATVTLTNVSIVQGYFTVELDFGTAFSDQERWLSLAVATNGGSFISLTPRQKFTPSPVALYAISSGALSNPLSSTQIGTNQVVKSINGLKDSVTLVAGENVTVLSNPNANQLAISSGAFTGNLADYSTHGLYIITNTSSTKMIVELWGAGGGGGGGGGAGHCSSTFYPGGTGGPGGAGGYCRAVLPLSPGAVYKIRIGAGGAGGAGGFLPGPNSSGTPGQPGQPGADTTIENSSGTVLLRSTGGQPGGGGPGGVCSVSSQNSGTNGPAGYGDMNAPIRRVGYVSGTITPLGVTGGGGGGSGLSAASGQVGGDGYAVLQW